MDWQQRSLGIWLAAPTQKTAANTLIKCTLDFPVSYPNEAGPVLSISDPPIHDDEWKDKVASDILDLTKAFLKKGRPSLEAILRYLLGERNLEQTLSWLGRPARGVLAGSHEDSDSSSEEDDDGSFAGPVQSTFNDMTASGSIRAANNTHYGVPLPNKCGARWASRGLLVYFRPSKQDSESSMLGESVSGKSYLSNNSKGVFQSFGGRSHALKRSVNDDSEEADFEISSSESSSPSADELYANQSFPLGLPWNNLSSGLLPRQKLSTSQKSVDDPALTDASIMTSKEKSAVVIVDLAKLVNYA